MATKIIIVVLFCLSTCSGMILVHLIYGEIRNAIRAKGMRLPADGFIVSSFQQGEVLKLYKSCFPDSRLVGIFQCAQVCSGASAGVLFFMLMFEIGMVSYFK
jgi:hypothetical protein